MSTLKLRIVVVNNTYMPQVKGWLFWSYIGIYRNEIISPYCLSWFPSNSCKFNYEEKAISRAKKYKEYIDDRLTSKQKIIKDLNL